MCLLSSLVQASLRFWMRVWWLMKAVLLKMIRKRAVFFLFD